MDKDIVERLEACPNPWCNSHRTSDCELRSAEEPILMPSRASFEWAVACPVCPLQTPWFDTEAEAITAWNTRAEPAEILALRERLAEVEGENWRLKERRYLNAVDETNRAHQALQPSTKESGE